MCFERTQGLIFLYGYDIIKKRNLMEGYIIWLTTVAVELIVILVNSKQSKIVQDVMYIKDGHFGVYVIFMHALQVKIFLIAVNAVISHVKN